jgi:hypothetical protein
VGIPAGYETSYQTTGGQELDWMVRLNIMPVGSFQFTSPFKEGVEISVMPPSPIVHPELRKSRLILQNTKYGKGIHTPVSSDFWYLIICEKSGEARI